MESNYSDTEWEWQYAKPQDRYDPLWFEVHDNHYWRKVMWDHPYIPYYACAIYLATIFGIQKYLRDKPPVKLQKTLVTWNLALSLFSVIGFIRIGSELLTIWSKPNGFYRSLCVREGRNIPADYWGLLFVLSKFLELGDTVFIVLRKQPLLALQWYHHCLVTLFAWKLYPWNEPILTWYSTINYGIHQFMYLYFALRGLRVKVPEVLAMMITTLQTTQMVIGLGINLFTVYMEATGEPCSRHPTSTKFSLFVYFSLWILFLKFFVDRYFNKSKLKAKRA